MTSSLLELQGVNIDRNNERLISDINFHLNPGERVTLLGANGTGKSTFLDALVGLHPLSGGDYTAFGKTLRTNSAWGNYQKGLPINCLAEKRGWSLSRLCSPWTQTSFFWTNQQPALMKAPGNDSSSVWQNSHKRSSSPHTTRI